MILTTTEDRMETDVRRNPGLLKLDLYCRGIRMDDPSVVEGHGGRKILRTRAGLGSGRCRSPSTSARDSTGRRFFAFYYSS